jgi:hypothetical protein
LWTPVVVDFSINFLLFLQFLVDPTNSNAEEII